MLIIIFIVRNIKINLFLFFYRPSVGGRFRSGNVATSRRVRNQFVNPFHNLEMVIAQLWWKANKKPGKNRWWLQKSFRQRGGGGLRRLSALIRGNNNKSVRGSRKAK